MDTRFKVNLLARTEHPNLLMYKCMHQCYSENFVSEEAYNLSESEYGKLCVKHLLLGNRGHYNPLEAPQSTLNVGYFPHSAMQQLRTHRTGMSMSVQSFRYSGERILELGISGEMHGIESTDIRVLSDDLINEIEEVFYIRPVGEYSDRKGKRYKITHADRHEDLLDCLRSAITYRNKINAGYSEEHARSMIPFDVRQHFTLSVNLRSILHILDLRAKKDAQLECQQLCGLIVPYLSDWVPEIWNWYEENRYQKARLSP